MLVDSHLGHLCPSGREKNPCAGSAKVRGEMFEHARVKTWVLWLGLAQNSWVTTAATTAAAPAATCEADESGAVVVSAAAVVLAAAGGVR